MAPASASATSPSCPSRSTTPPASSRWRPIGSWSGAASSSACAPRASTTRSRRCSGPTRSAPPTAPMPAPTPVRPPARSTARWSASPTWPRQPRHHLLRQRPLPALGALLGELRLQLQRHAAERRAPALYLEQRDRRPGLRRLALRSHQPAALPASERRPQGGGDQRQPRRRPALRRFLAAGRTLPAERLRQLQRADRVSRLRPLPRGVEDIPRVAVPYSYRRQDLSGELSRGLGKSSHLVFQVKRREWDRELPARPNETAGGHLAAERRHQAQGLAATSRPAGNTATGRSAATTTPTPPRRAFWSRPPARTCPPCATPSRRRAPTTSWPPS